MGKQSHIKLIPRETEGQTNYYKECLTCAEIKELGEYYKSAKGLGGHASRCKKCTAIYFKKYNKTNQTYNKVFEVNGESYKRCSSCLKEQLTLNFYTKRNGFTSDCKPCYLEKKRKGTGYKPINIVIVDGEKSKECRSCGDVKPLTLFPKNGKKGVGRVRHSCKECSKAEWKRYRDSNVELARERSKTWRLANPQKQMKAQRRWRLNNKEKDTLYQNTRKTRKMYLRDDLSHTQWEEALDRFNRSCALTGETENVTMDHFIPISFGGGTYLGNVYPLSSTLNNSKHNRNPYEWYEKYGKGHGVSYSAWQTLNQYLAELNGMTPAEYRKYVDSLYEKDRGVGS